MTQKMIDSNIDKNTEKKVEELFYSESNMKYLEKVIADIESGKAKLVEHDLIEE
jgi:addiction module antitoxin, relB/dinJ family